MRVNPKKVPASVLSFHRRDRKKRNGMKKKAVCISFFAFTCFIMILSIWGPEVLERYRDHIILNKIHTQAVDTAEKGYRYTLNRNEKLYILSEALNTQVLSGNENMEAEYQELSGTYAFVVNHKGPSEKEITDEQIYETCSNGFKALAELGILPDTIKAVEKEGYNAVLYTAIDVLEPRNNVAVWKISLSNSQKISNKENRLIDAYIDADDGKIYEFYARTSLDWADIDPDAVIKKWSDYMGLSNPVPYEAENPLMETTPYFKKYVYSGSGEETTIVTIGFYEGINELFIKITK